MKKRILKTILVLILIINFTMFDFVILGENIAIAISENMESQGMATNVQNVEFDAYLKNGEEPVHEKVAQITSEEILVLNINVKEKGIFNDGKIKLENVNFTIQKDKIQNSYIKNINLETNEIELNSIIYQNYVRIEIPIIFTKKEEFEADYFQKEIAINLEGTYKDEKEQKVKAQRTLKINWTQEADVIVNQNFNKYIALNEIGTLLQQEITTEVTDNALPREDENILVQVPILEEQQPKEVYVVYNGMRLPAENVEYTKETKVLEIKPNHIPSWKKQVNTYQIIYIYDQTVDTIKRTVELNTLVTTKLFTKEAITKQETKSTEIEPMGNVVTLEKTATKEIYKGYLYAKVEQETTFTENNKLQIANQEATNEIELIRGGEQFSDDNQLFDISDYVIDKNTIVKKEEFDRILGQEGNITITDENNQILGQINKDSVADENGNLIIQYEGETKNIKVTTSKPVNEGYLTISHTRAIKGDVPYSKEQLKSFQKMITTTKVVNNQGEETAEAQILLKDTKTEAKLALNNTKFSTLQVNENVQFLVTLKSDSIQYDLYKNPLLKVVLPAELSVQVKNITQLNAQEELTIVSPKLYDNENGEKVIEIPLQGEQTNFANAMNEGIQISIIADITIDKTVPSKNSEVKMIYTNENREAEEFNTVLPIKLNSKYGVLVVNKLSQYNEKEDTIESVDDKVKEVTLERNTEAREAKQEIAIVNNYENEITDVVIIGKIPAIGQEEINGQTLKATFEMQLKNAIQTEGKVQKITYSENPDETKESDNWTETPEDFTKVKAFKIELDNHTIMPQEVIKISYPFMIPENLGENEEAYTNIKVSYHYLGDTIDFNSTMLLKTGKLEEAQEERVINEIEGVTVELSGKTGGKNLVEGQEVYEGQGILYGVTVTNHTQNEITNMKVKAIQSNAIFYSEKIYNDGWDSSTYEENLEYTRIEENPELQEKEILVGTLKPGETKQINYQFSVKEIEEDEQTTEGKIVVTADNIEAKEIKTLTNLIKQAKIKVQMRSKYEEEYKMTSNREYPFFIDVTNLSEEEQKDVEVQLEVPNGYGFKTDYLFPSDAYQFVDYEENIITLKIPTIASSEKIPIRLGLYVEAMDLDTDKMDSHLYATAILKQEKYVSNEISKTIYNAESKITARQTGSLEKETLKDGDNLTYTCIVENEGPQTKEVDLSDNVPNGANITKVEVKLYDITTGELKSSQEIEANQYNFVNYIQELEVNNRLVLSIHTVIHTDEIFTSEIVNKIDITTPLQTVTCNEVRYKVEGKEDLSPEEDMTYQIQGVAWKDENKNGLRESTEARLANIKVFLLDGVTGDIVLDENGKQRITTTDQNGEYTFQSVKQGKYVVILEYDATKYRITEYQKRGISETNNSDVIARTIKLEGEEKQVATTETLQITGFNLENIDAGFIEGEKFDFKLEKYIRKIIVQNNKGTTVKQYDKSKLAKIELDSKSIQNSTVIMEYQIEVTNEGEIGGYVNEIVDYKPADLSFSSEMNQNWYQSTNGEIRSSELSNQMIQPGETKTVVLTLVKKMTTNNTGTTINSAEIAKASNDLALEDVDSIPGNKVNGEDDMSTAEVIISIRTGTVIMYFTLVISMIMIIGVGIYFINQKVLKSDLDVEWRD